MLASRHVAVRGLSHRYRGRSESVLKDVDFSVPQGEILAIVGRSGCGKSTLLHLIAGLLHATSGAVEVGGALVRGPSPRRVMMFQQPLLFPWMSVRQNAALGLRFAGHARDGAKARVEGLLAMLGLSEFADVDVQSLSGGQQQRVALARSLAIEPDLLLLDEPFSALDAFTRQDLQRQVRAMARRLGLTLVLVTHDIDEAVRMADRALVMAPNPGRIVADLTFRLDDDRDSNDPGALHERARLLDALGESADAAQPARLLRDLIGASAHV